MSIAAQLLVKKDPNTEKRTAERWKLELRAGFRKRGYETAKADVRDLSTTGFKVDSIMNLVPEAEVLLKLPGIEPKRATVMWVQGFRAGCEFETPFHEAVLEDFLGKHDAAKRFASSIASR